MALDNLEKRNLSEKRIYVYYNDFHKKNLEGAKKLCHEEQIAIW